MIKMLLLLFFFVFFFNFNLVLSRRENINGRIYDDDDFISKETYENITKSFYELDTIKDLKLKYSDWNMLLIDFDVMTVSNQTSLFQKMKTNLKSLEVALLELCTIDCVKNSCEEQILDELILAKERFPVDWKNFEKIDWKEIPLKIKKLVVLQLRYDHKKLKGLIENKSSQFCYQK